MAQGVDLRDVTAVGVQPGHFQDLDDLLVLAGETLDLDSPRRAAPRGSRRTGRPTPRCRWCSTRRSFQSLELRREATHRLDVGDPFLETLQRLIDLIEEEMDLPVLFERLA